MSARRFIDVLNLDMLIAPGVILCKDGTLLAGWSADGLDIESMEPDALAGRLSHLGFALSGLGDAHTIWSVFRRRPWLPDGETSLPLTDNLALDVLADESRILLSVPGVLWTNDLFLYLAWTPSGANLPLTQQIVEFEEECARFAARIGAVFTARRLGHETRSGEPDWTNCALCSALASLFGQDRDVAIPTEGSPVALDVLLGVSAEVGRGDRQLRIEGRPTALLPLTGWPSAYGIAPLVALQDLAMPYAWVTRYDPMSPQTARSAMRWLQKRFSQASSDMIGDVVSDEGGRRSRFEDTMAEGLEEAIAETSLAEDGHGELVSQILLIGAPGEERSDLLPAIQAIEEAAGNSGFQVTEETVNALPAFLSALPGHAHVNRRRVYMNARAVADLIPARSIWQGARSCPSPKLPAGTPPLAYARSRSGELFRFNLHSGDLGHTLMFGPTGAGKSVLLGFLAASWLRYPEAQVIYFDRGQSSRHACNALGGRFVELGTGGTAGLAPLSHLAELGADWGLRWITEMARFALGSVSLDQARELREAIDNLSDTARPKLRQVWEYVQDRDLREAFVPWFEGPQAGLFDHDGLDIGAELGRAALTVFETEALFDARLDVSVLSLDFVFAQVARRFTGRPTLIILDEAWSFFGHELFLERIRTWLKTGRKQNVAVLMATQSIDDAVRAEITSVLLESCPTKIFLPNAEAQGRIIGAQYAALGLEPAEIGLIASIQPKQDYFIIQPAGKRVVSFPLGRAAMSLLARTGADDSARAARLFEENPDYWKEELLSDVDALAAE